MPPAAMASSVVRAIWRDRSDAGVAVVRRQSSTRVGRGNFGAGPNPPHAGSKPCASPVTSCSISPSASRSPPAGRRPGPARRTMSTHRLGQASLRARTASTSASAWARPCLVPFPRPCRAPRPPGGTRACRGAPRAGSRCRRRRAAVGRAEHRHGPTARSGQRLGGRHVERVEVGRSSRSTLTEMNQRARSSAVASSSKLSWAITWHQWQEA